ncbi:hypothetical protein IW262DRAFT_1289769 [Armillaria fumosa]|nr:hypothetical protein IW262DRAFT_1289769 [Armillaria fumosa]
MDSKVISCPVYVLTRSKVDDSSSNQIEQRLDGYGVDGTLTNTCFRASTNGEGKCGRIHEVRTKGEILRTRMQKWSDICMYKKNTRLTETCASTKVLRGSRHLDHADISITSDKTMIGGNLPKNADDIMTSSYVEDSAYALVHSQQYIRLRDVLVRGARRYMMSLTINFRALSTVTVCVRKENHSWVHQGSHRLLAIDSEEGRKHLYMERCGGKDKAHYYNESRGRTAAYVLNMSIRQFGGKCARITHREIVPHASHLLSERASSPWRIAGWHIALIVLKIMRIEISTVVRDEPSLRRMAAM